MSWACDASGGTRARDEFDHWLACGHGVREVVRRAVCCSPPVRRRRGAPLSVWADQRSVRAASAQRLVRVNGVIDVSVDIVVTHVLCGRCHRASTLLMPVSSWASP